MMMIISIIIIVFQIRKGELHLTESVCPRDFLGELEYWGLSALHIGHILYHTSLFCTVVVHESQCFYWALFPKLIYLYLGLYPLVAT